jgi:hypothetical protein
MGLNYNRGFNRIYVLLAAAWVLWGLYKPVADHKREIKEVIEIANRDA